MPRAKTVLYRLAVLATGMLAFSPARGDTSLEYAVKAAYLTKFVPFIEWPDAAFTAAAAPITICIMGADPFGDTIDKAAGGVSGGGRRLAIRRLAPADAADGCQMVYAGDAAALDALAGKPVVTVTDSGMAVRGVISFVMLDNHVRFDIDDAAAARGGIRISSKLLELAHSVTRRGAGP
jgi:hypothetical protein